MTNHDLIVVGGGIAGSAAALRAAQYRLPTIWILGDKRTRKASRSAYVKNIDNMIGVHPDIVLSKVVQILEADHPEAARKIAGVHMHISTAEIIDNARARIEADFPGIVTIVDQRATKAVQIDGGFRVSVTNGTDYDSGSLLLATGVMDRQPVVHRTRGGRDLTDVHWLFPYANQETLLYCIRCQGHLTIGRRVGVIGSGNGTAEVALMIHERYGSEVTILTAGSDPSWNSERGRLLASYSIPVVEGEIVDVEGADRGSTLSGFTVEGERKVLLDLAFVSMGLHRVYNDLAISLGARLEEGEKPEEVRHVRVDTYGETSVRGLFAVGDMASREDEPVMKQVYTAQEYAVRAVDTIDRRRRRAAREAGIVS